MIDRIKSVFSKMEAQQKKRTMVALIVGVVILIGYIGYKVNHGEGSTTAVRMEKKKDIALDSKMLEKSAYLEGQKDKVKTEAKLSALESQFEDIKKQKATDDVAKTEKDKQAQVNGNVSAAQAGVGKDVGAKRSAAIPPPPPGVPPAPNYNQKSPAAVGVPVSAKESPEQLVGGIEIVSVSRESSKTALADKDKKKEPEQIYLPPSYMEASLLSGLDAPVIENAKSDPVPVLMRVAAPAVLPNSVKANLKGCFVIAHGLGSLSSERVNLRLVSISCIAKSGQAVIDQDIKGFVVAEDGKIGLPGRVVSKMGAAVARSMVAGFFGGLGDAFKSSSQTVSFSPLGATAVPAVDGMALAKAGIGGGVSQASKEIEKIYDDLVRASMPVIEVGATRVVTLVLEKGVMLEIKNYCVGGSKCAK